MLYQECRFTGVKINNLLLLTMKWHTWGLVGHRMLMAVLQNNWMRFVLSCGNHFLTSLEYISYMLDPMMK